MYRAAGDRRGVAKAHQGLGDANFLQREYAAARERYEEALLTFRDDPWLRAWCLEGLAATAAAERRLERAVRLFAAAATARAALGAPTPGLSRAEHDKWLAATRGGLDPAAFGAGWKEGQAMTPEEAAAYQPAPCEPAPLAAAPSPAAPPRSRSPLTVREEEVVGLVARGWTNRQIADELVIGVRTAETHVANALGKLALATRAELAAWAVEHGLRRVPATTP